MKKVIILSLLAFSFVSIFAQKGAEKRGDKLFRKLSFKAAAEAYEKASKKNPDNLGLSQKLARAYVLSENHIAAEEAYANIVKVDSAPAIAKFYYAQELRSNGKYKEAAAQYSKFATTNPEDARSKEFEGALEKIQPLNQDTRLYNISNMTINTPASEFGAAFYKTDLVFTANKTKSCGIIRKDTWSGSKFYDMFVSSPDANGNFTDSKLLRGKKLNKKFHDGPACFSADGQEMFFTRTSLKKTRINNKKQKIANLQIMYAQFDHDKQKWGTPIALPFNSSEYSTGHPAITADGKKLYFISDMPGGFGETDIYVSTKEGTTWATPVNLGKSVNTPGRELFPFIAKDGTLYFSSDSRIGLGGLDVYSANYETGVWTNVQNLGAPINTRSDDFGYVIDDKNKNGYVVSDREGGQGSDDIYKFLKLGIALTGTVTDAKTGEILPGAELKLFDGEKLVNSKVSGAKGNYSFVALPNKTYRMEVGKMDYKTTKEDVTTGSDNQTANFSLIPDGIELNVCVREPFKSVTVTGAIVELTNKATGEKKTCTIDENCKCKFELQEDADYTICATRETDMIDGVYEYICKDISTRGISSPTVMKENIDIYFLALNEILKPYNVYHDLAKPDLAFGKESGLRKIANIMKRYNKIEIELASHTDCRGSKALNDVLSTKRAVLCHDWLVKDGIESKRITAIGMGKRKLVNNCTCDTKGKSNTTCTEEQHLQNRRTEFKILKLK